MTLLLINRRYHMAIRLRLGSLTRPAQVIDPASSAPLGALHRHVFSSQDGGRKR